MEDKSRLKKQPRPKKNRDSHAPQLQKAVISNLQATAVTHEGNCAWPT